MSKISEQKALEVYPKDKLTAVEAVNRTKRFGYIQGYDQAMQDFLEKAEKILTERMYFQMMKQKNSKTTYNMPKFKIGDKISNGKIQYTVLDIQTNCLGDSCYVFKHPIKDNNFIWISEEVDESFELVQTDSDELVPTNSDSFDWQSFRAEAAKDILCAMIARGEKVKSIVVDIAIDGADELIKQLKEKEEK